MRGIHLIHMVSGNETGAYEVSDVNNVSQGPVPVGFVRLVMIEYRFAHELRHTPATGQQVPRIGMSYTEQSFLHCCQIVALYLKLPVKERISGVHVLVEDHLSDVMEETSRVSQVGIGLSGKFRQLAADAGCPTAW